VNATLSNGTRCTYALTVKAKRYLVVNGKKAKRYFSCKRKEQNMKEVCIK